MNYIIKWHSKTTIGEHNDLVQDKFDNEMYTLNYEHERCAQKCH